MRAAPTALFPPRASVLGVVILAPALAFAFPWLDHLLNPDSATPGLISFLGVGLSVWALTVVLLFGGLRGVLPKGGVFLAAMFGYNSVLVLIKFALSPFALYVTSETRGFVILSTSSNNTLSFVAFLAFPILTAVTAALYGAAFFLLYLYFRSGLRRRLGVHVSIERSFVVVFLTMFGVGVAGSIAGGLGVFSFLEYVFSFFSFVPLALLLAFALLMALMLASIAFREATEQAALTRNVAVLGTFALVGIAFIAAYHILWLVFILTLVALFPLKAMNVK
jgi:hypothetical protein